MERLRVLKGKYFIAGVAIAVAYYFVDAMMMAFFFEEGSLIDNILLPTPDDIWMRFSIATILIILGAVVQDRIFLQRDAKEKLAEMNVELILERDKANAANHAKSEFLASMSHDLRTPLNAIIGFSDVMKMEVFGPITNHKYAEYAADIHSSGAFLLQLVNDILDISKVEARELSLYKEDIDFPDLAAECLSVLETMGGDKNVKCLMNIPSDLPPLYADRQSMKQILLNLTTNAIKYTPSGGCIILSASLSNNHHIIEVKDTGEGIPFEALQTITEPFTRVDNNSTNPHDGTGLGLAIVKSLVGFHNGKLNIASKVGAGTTVTITLPFRPNQVKENQSVKLLAEAT